MKWLKKNWLKILIAIVVIWAVTSGISGVVDIVNLIKDNKQYKENIGIKDEEISKLKNSNRISENIIKDLMSSRENEKDAVREEIKKMEKNQKKELARIGKERDEWKKKVKDLPASVVVIKIRKILNTDEIWERPDGILFSLEASKDCLAILGDFSLVEKRDRWKADYFTAMEKVSDLNKLLTVDEEIFYYFNDISLTKDEIDGLRIDKFNLSNSQKRKNYWKGLKLGVPVGAILGLLIGLALGK